MSADIYSYQPSQGHGLAHDPLNAIIAPRPIGWISSSSATGQRNLAPYSFFNLFNYQPPIIGFASSGWKDSVANIAATREFVWNLVTEPLAVAMNQSSAPLSADQDEFTFAGLKALPSELIKVDRVAESPVHFECRLTQIIQLRDTQDHALDSWLVLGEVVMIHIQASLLDNDGVYQTVKAAPILRAGGPSAYYGITEDQRIDLWRPNGK